MNTQTQVTIIGAGPVGLSTAIALARQGIKSIVIEKHPSITNHPKARGVNTRTMELFRLWGIAESLSQYQLPPEALRFIWMESLQGKELTRISAKNRPNSVSPIEPAIISQDWVEYELLKVLRNYPEIECHFNHRMLQLEETEQGVNTIIEDSSGVQTIIHSDYVVAADGAASTTRRLLNIGMQGRDNMGEFCNIYCEMDLSQYVADRISVGFILTRADIMGTFILSKDGQQKWLIGIRYDQDESLSRESFTDEFCIQLIKKIIDDDSIEVKLINKAFWTMAALVAAKYRQGRILLAGDAAHRLPPTGGLGMNTGIQDAHNLAWKLAAVINKQASSALLDTYYQERAPVALNNIEWSTKNAMRFNRIFTALYEKDYDTMNSALEEQNEHLNQLGLDIGFRYEEGALVNDNSPAPAINTDSYIPSTYPGSRAPHYLLHKSGKSISTLDLFDKHFVLLSSDKSRIWQQAAESIGFLPIDSYQIGINGDLQDPDGKWLTTYEISEDGAVLIRPDGHVAWRSQGTVDDAKQSLLSALKKLGFEY